MSKKSFKDNTANIDRFFSAAETDKTSNTSGISNIYNISETSETYKTEQKPYMLSLKFNSNFKQYISDEAWKARKTITAYLTDIIQADMDAKTHETYKTEEISFISKIPDMSNISEMQANPYRMSLKLHSKFKQYLSDEAWKARKTINDYVNGLLQADMDRKNKT
jgi:hypothetical protein